MAQTSSKISHPEQVVLSNGIPVILQHYDGPAAATYWWIRTGSADESPKEAGFAHFLEHMLFKDAAAKETGKASTGQMARAIESLGGEINAYTSFDQTVYHVTCAAHHWERVIDAFGPMAKPQRFLKEDFEREREVILEELRKNEDSPGRQLFQTLFTQTFKKHPYGKPVIGYIKTLNAAKVGNLEAFYKRQYVSERMGLILVGPLNDPKRRAAVLARVEKYYGKKVIPAKKAAKAATRPTEAPLRGKIATAKREFDVKTPTLSISFRVPELSHPDMPALDLLGGILGMGELSRLYQELFYGKSLVTDVSAGVYVPSDPGMLYLQAEVDSKEKILPAAEEILRQMKRLRDEGPTPEELKRVLVNSESDRLYSSQTADGLAGRVGFLKFIVGDLDFDRKYLDELRAVDPARIREVAREYFDVRRMSVVALLPKADKSYDLKQVERAAATILAPLPHPASEKASKKKSKGSKGHDLPVEFIQLPSGIRVAHVDRPASHVFSVHSAMLGGTRLEQPDSAGINHLLASTWNKGTSSKDAREISRIVEGHAAGMDGFSGRNSMGLQMTGLDRDWGTLSQLFTEVLLDPTFAQSEIDHSKRVIEDSIRSIEDHSSQLCSRLFMETLFEHHPYGKLVYGSLESLSRLDQQKLRAYHRARLRPDEMMIAVSGPISRTSLDTWLADLDVAASKIAKAGGSRGETVIQEEPELKAPRWVEKNLGREQTHILVGGLGLRILDEERFAFRLMQTLLGGQSGRLFIELREKKSLAYSVAPMSFEGLERGYVGTYIACAPPKKDEAIKGIRTVLETLAAKGPTLAEMTRAKEFYLGRRSMDLQSDSALASHFGLEGLYRLPHLTEDEFTRKVRSVTAQQIRDVCRRYLVEPHMVTSTVG